MSSARLLRSANTSNGNPSISHEWRDALHNLFVCLLFFLLAQLVTGCEASLNLRVFCDQRWIGGLPINKPDQALNPTGFFGISTFYEKFCLRPICQHAVPLQETLPSWPTRSRNRPTGGDKLQYPAKSCVRMSYSSMRAPTSISFMPATMAGGPAL